MKTAEEMTREEFIEKWGASMGHGFTDEELSADLDSLFPPAEGAEAFVKRLGLNVDYVKGIDLFPNPKYTVIDLMREFAAQSQPTAEGAEEILTNLETYYDFKFHWIERDRMIRAMHEFATLHAQKIADKMVSEKLREELIKYEIHWNFVLRDNAEKVVDEYLKSRESHDNIR